MSKLQLVESLKDVLPNFTGDYPPTLLSYVDSIYQLSLQRMPSLPNRADVARYHLCAYLAVDRYQQRFLLPPPVAERIPVQPKHLPRLLEDLQQRVLGDYSTPVSTPRKRPSLDLLPAKQFTPRVGSPLKKMRTLQSEGQPAFSAESPFNPGGKDSNLLLRDVDSPFNTKVGASPTKSPRKTPQSSKISPLKSTLSSPTTPRYLRQLSIPDFISFANNFYIPAKVTPHLLETFTTEKFKFVKKNEWLLACGIIHAAYIRINDRLLQSTIGKKTELQDQLFQYQKGGLMKSNMIMWINIIEESLKGLPWVVDLELKYVHNNWTTEDTTQEREILAKLGRGWELMLSIGSMITPSEMFDKSSQKVYFKTWTDRVHAELKKLT